MFFVYSLWHWILFQSPYKHKMHKVKFNKEYPDNTRWSHDRFWTLIGSFVSSLMELSIIYIYKIYPSLLQLTFWNKTWYISIGWLVFIDIQRVVHFYFIHRLMHPWFKRDSKYSGYDLGACLYRNVHYLHHESYNPGVWSGLSMHPVEHVIYYSCIYVPLVFGIMQHPVHVLTIKWNANLAPISGHDGFDEPSGGGYYHYLHHAHFECNYGTAFMDQLLGTFEDGSKYNKK